MEPRFVKFERPGMKYFACTLALAVALCVSRADSQTLTTLLQFSGSSGAAIGGQPHGSLTLVGTSLYGMTFETDDFDFGNIYSVGIDGTNYQNLVSFTGNGGTASGSGPNGSLTLGGTTLYGMTSGAPYLGYYGNVFSVGLNGTNYQNLDTFTGVNGAEPYGSLTLVGTTLYGMTQLGGHFGNGTIFSTGTDGTNYRNLVFFTGTGGTAAGSSPFGNLTLSGTTLYGMTADGGANFAGNIFSVGTDGTNFHNLVSFTGSGGIASGRNPYGSLTLSGTTLYGMTTLGGASGNGNVFSVGIDGTNYQNLLSFTGDSGAAIGSHPVGSLVLSGTTLYGTTGEGSPYYVGNTGNVFSIGIDGSDYQNLYIFTGGSDGAEPAGDLTLSDGTLFGTTLYGGASPLPNGYGTVFALILPTPEPGTQALVGAGAVALLSYRWRRTRKRRLASKLCQS
jgi:uncharacterized repeat protein (TIGR03803 family)